MRAGSEGELAATWAFVGLGSNLGDRVGNILQAFDRLSAVSGQPLLRSSLWETKPIDCPPGSLPFINAVAGFQPLTGETPESLLAKLQEVEREFGRKPKLLLNEARPLDLDLLLFGQELRHTPELTLPHPRAQGRAFVLAPLAELAPELRFPGGTSPVKELLTRLPDQGVHRYER